MITLRHSIDAAAEMYYLSGKRKDPPTSVEPGRDGIILDRQEILITVLATEK
jgi:hypothetical protein